MPKIAAAVTTNALFMLVLLEKEILSGDLAVFDAGMLSSRSESQVGLGRPLESRITGVSNNGSLE
jgi:hypothetical protein